MKDIEFMEFIRKTFQNTKSSEMKQACLLIARNKIDLIKCELQLKKTLNKQPKITYN